jgi:MoaA/NifB/PqqE/SkfB family radical SAM enzyme
MHFLKSIGLMFTYKCNLGLSQCPVKAGPHRLEEIPIDTAFRLLDQLKRYGKDKVTGITLTGGEPFYNLNLLIRLSDYAHQLGFIVTVVTNGFWASSETQAEHILMMCPSIDVISINTDIIHLEHIPIESIANVIHAAKKLDRQFEIMMESDKATAKNSDPFFNDLSSLGDSSYLHRLIYMSVGSESIESHRLKQRKDEDKRMVCQSANIPVILPDGCVMACLGYSCNSKRHHPMYLGNINEQSIKDIFEQAEGNYILHAIRTFGPKILIRLLNENGYADRLPSIDIKAKDCEVCSSLFSDPDIFELLQYLVDKDMLFRSKVEYGRMYYLNEPEMVKRRIVMSHTQDS